MSTVITTADEQRDSPIGALYPYLQHRSPACTEGCACGARAAVLAVEQQLRDREAAAAAELAFIVGAVRDGLGGLKPGIGAALAAMSAALDGYNKLRGA